MDRFRSCVAVTVLVAWSVALVAAPKVPNTCSERNLLRDSKGNIVWFTHDQMKGMATKIVPPKMGPFLRGSARIQGTVVLGVVVGPDGHVSCLWAIIGPPMLLPDVLDAVKQWEFKPQQSNGKPVAFGGALVFSFRNGYEF